MNPVEELQCVGRSFHCCFLFMIDRKKLDSVTAAFPDEKTHCKSCHGKKNGPKGLSVAGALACSRWMVVRG